MKNVLLRLFASAIAISFFASCVSVNEFNKAKDALKECDEELQLLRKEFNEAEVRANESGAKARRFESVTNELQKQVDTLEEKVSSLERNNKRLEDINSVLDEQLKAAKSEGSEQITQLLNDLEKTRLELEAREEKLVERNRRLQELENLLSQKDQSIKALKESVVNALTGYQDLGVSVTEKNGRVYVSLDEKLLFETGKYNVAANGRDALKKLSVVLASNTDIDILVEGHTDDVPLRSAGEIKDNWDLSVMRANSVTKILLQNRQLDPKRIISAGRSSYVPIDPDKTVAARQKNRRTEIILSPDLGKLFELLEKN